MARRRWASRRSSPDMGWVVGNTQLSLTHSGLSDHTAASITLFDFADIDPEALTGRIEADKSDWFIKRAILNIYAAASLEGLGAGDTARLFAWGLTVANTENTNDLLGTNQTVYGPEWYNNQARILRTGLMPAYHAPVLPLAAGSESGTIGVSTILGAAPGAADPVGYSLLFGMWGPAARHEDMVVSNAGLRNNQTVEFYCNTIDASIYGWDGGDALNVELSYQFLMQKRRA